MRKNTYYKLQVRTLSSDGKWLDWDDVEVSPPKKELISAWFRQCYASPKNLKITYQDFGRDVSPALKRMYVKQPFFWSCVDADNSKFNFRIVRRGNWKS